MIIFKRLFYKNFLSTGNAGIEIWLNRHSTTLVSGASGAGKSTMIDALCFGLFGKPFRDINKPQLVNAINGKQLLVEVEFDIGGINYLVRRGIKPNLFEIFANGKQLNQEAAARDYQDMLESQILRMSHRTFTQIVVLGSSDYVPFMQLPAAQRREVIENILDIDVFGTMMQLLKSEQQQTRNELVGIESELKTMRAEAQSLRNLIGVAQKAQQERIDTLRAEIEHVQAKIAAAQDQRNDLVRQSTELKQTIDRIRGECEAESELRKRMAAVHHTMQNAKKTIDFLHKHDSCPVCKQDITPEHRDAVTSSLTNEYNAAKARSQQLEEIERHLQDKKRLLHQHENEFISIMSSITKLDAQIDTETNYLQRLIDDVTALTNASTDPNAATESQARIRLAQIADKALAIGEHRKRLLEMQQIQDAAYDMLRDTGIKTAIVRQYLPYINHYLNKYLTELQLDVQFTLDEQFNEVVRSRYRDEFVYGNFSTGEKTRIDIALLLTWRKIAELKNSTTTNLLIVDEIFGGVLDANAQDVLVDLFNALAQEGGNFFIIAHGEHLYDKFKTQIRFEKRGNFTVLV